MATDASSEREIVIIGGGIIGSTTAYFLSRHPSFNPSLHHITILEATSIASGASGKAGGLLALWSYPASIVPLSYKLHAELSKEYDGPTRWGYRTLNCGSLRAKGKVNDSVTAGDAATKSEEWQKLPKTEMKTKIAEGIPADLDWFDGDAMEAFSEMGTPETTAQIHPYQFTTSMAELSGAKVILGRATAIDAPDGTVKGLVYEERKTGKVCTLAATDIIISAGPWTPHILPSAPISSVRAHSVVIKAVVSPYAVFSEIDLPSNFGSGGKRKHGKTVSPEMYARPDGTVYACGEADSLAPLPKTSDLVVCDQSRCEDIISYVGSISKVMREGEVMTKQACYLASVTGGGGPLIGKTNTAGLYLASGHTCWGIQNAPATGKLMSEFVFGGEAKSARVEMLDPRKFL